jgi:hypothetical protein
MALGVLACLFIVSASAQDAIEMVQTKTKVSGEKHPADDVIDTAVQRVHEHEQPATLALLRKPTVHDDDDDHHHHHHNHHHHDHHDRSSTGAGDGIVEVNDVSGLENAVSTKASKIVLDCVSAPCVYHTTAPVVIDYDLILEAKVPGTVVLDGGDTHRVLEIKGDSTAPSTVTITGLNITNGKGLSPFNYQGWQFAREDGAKTRGGCINVVGNGRQYMSLTIDRCNIYSCQSLQTVPQSMANNGMEKKQDNGGGIFIWKSTVTVSNSIFHGNQKLARKVFTGEDSSPRGTLGMYDYGGALFIWESTVSVSGSEFYDNTGMQGGGAINAEKSDFTMTDSKVHGNRAGGRGGDFDSLVPTSTKNISCPASRSTLIGCVVKLGVTGGKPLGQHVTIPICLTIHNRGAAYGPSSVVLRLTKGICI